jgi:hypothetical protein
MEVGTSSKQFWEFHGLFNLEICRAGSRFLEGNHHKVAKLVYNHNI